MILFGLNIARIVMCSLYLSLITSLRDNSCVRSYSKRLHVHTDEGKPMDEI